MKLFGLTGGIGMGKSTSMQFLRQRGVAVVDTDDLARQFVQPGQPALAEIQKEFGNDLVGNAGELRRAALAEIVFADAAARKKLEAILHPRIREEWIAQAKALHERNCPVAVVVIPLLFETRADGEFDSVVCVACTAPTQHRRLVERGWNAQQIEQRIAAQQPIEQKMARSNFVIWTEGDLESHAGQLRRVIPSK